ncbi:MAG TPA: hypothetical protein VHB47_11920, partial [Thermoanaerobaculia bacterium]|nr:hypothetical protein [Thermoanaerobaculia bacterium]
HDALFVQLGLKPGPDRPLAPWLLAEGFTTTEPRGFVREFRAWLARGRRFFSTLRDAATPAAMLEAFAAAARNECRLPLARYLFTPAEVLERIAGQVRVSRGVASPLWMAGGLATGEAERALSRLPPYEAAIATALCESSLIYWVADGTDARFNSLIAQPPATVALAVRPPGSCLELEIKRSGCRGPHLWNVIVRRDGEVLPFTHRFAGASMLPALQRDARHSSRLAAIYRRVHAAEASLGSALALAAVYGVPSGTAEEHVLDYFSQPAAFGAGYRAMRDAMRELVASCRYAAPGWHTAELDTELGLTLQFLHHYPPGQSILCGTSSLRLDRVARYLSVGGAMGTAAAAVEREHGEEPVGAPGPGEPRGSTASIGSTAGRRRARHRRELTDDMLDEVLGLYVPPRVPYRGQRAYVAAAFAVPANRARADRIYGALMRELGRLWGTLLAVRGYSHGESFVSRNVGLLSAWEDGRWRVHIVFMDHDNLTLPGHGEDAFHPARALPGMELDGTYVWGRVRPKVPYQPIGVTEFLGRIYRIDRAGARLAKAALRRELVRAYRRTQAVVRRDPRLAAFFHPQFVRRLGDWDEIARLLVATPRGGELDDAFAAAVRRRLAGKGYHEELIEEHLAAAREHAEQVRRFAFLYRRAASRGRARR